MPKYLMLKPGGQRLLSELLRAHGVDFAMPCAGNHTCGKCKVQVLYGLHPMSEGEARFLRRDEIDAGFRLACFAEVAGEVFVKFDGRDDAVVLSECGGAASGDVAPLMSANRYGLAVDIGTTTVVCSIFSGREAAPLRTIGEPNRQRRYGADVISRINYGVQHDPDEVRDAIRAQLRSMVDRLCAETGVQRDEVTHAVVAGNTTMLHFFAGLDPKGIGFFPFTPQSLFDCEDDASLPGIATYIPPCVGPYVGADLLCCVLASRMAEKKQVSCIVDIGTNGEMALFHDGEILCCSTAAGPAFEGGGIDCGMPACAGAIAGVSCDPIRGEVAYETIDDAPAVGVCGSGLVDWAAVLLRHGALDENGLLRKDGHPLARYMREDERGVRFLFPDSRVYISQADVRQLQLAKGAIFAGIRTLLERAGLAEKDLEAFYICGGFGKFLNLQSAEEIGLIPCGLRRKAIVLGNGALGGAASILCDTANRTRIESLAKISSVVELSLSQDFMENYIDAMGFDGTPKVV